MQLPSQQQELGSQASGFQQSPQQGHSRGASLGTAQPVQDLRFRASLFRF